MGGKGRASSCLPVSDPPPMIRREQRGSMLFSRDSTLSGSCTPRQLPLPKDVTRRSPPQRRAAEVRSTAPGRSQAAEDCGIRRCCLLRATAHARGAARCAVALRQEVLCNEECCRRSATVRPAPSSKMPATPCMPQRVQAAPVWPISPMVLLPSLPRPWEGWTNCRPWEGWTHCRPAMQPARLRQARRTQLKTEPWPNADSYPNLPCMPQLRGRVVDQSSRLGAAQDRGCWGWRGEKWLEWGGGRQLGREASRTLVWLGQGRHTRSARCVPLVPAFLPGPRQRVVERHVSRETCLSRLIHHDACRRASRRACVEAVGGL